MSGKSTEWYARSIAAALSIRGSRAAVVGPRVQDPAALAERTLGDRLGPAAATAIARAESRPEAVALLLMSPEFQRR